MTMLTAQQARADGYLTDLRSLARVEPSVVADGPGSGSRIVRVANAGGLEFDLYPDRALDLGRVTFGGVPYSWSSPVGYTAPGLAVDDEFGWLATFGGGLLATCGLDTIGDPSTTAAGTHPQHGRVGTTPSRVTRSTVDEEAVLVEAETRQTAVHGENLVLRRSVRSELGSRELTVTDTVTNEGGRDSVHMILYHCNLGWPLLEPGTVINTGASAVTRAAADPAGSGAGDDWSVLVPPSRNAGSLVYVHTLDSGPHHTVTVRNRARGMRLEIGFDTGTLPFLHQWKCLQWGQYVIGIEPSNTSTLAGRATAEEQGVAPVLSSGESVQYTVSFRFGGSEE